MTYELRDQILHRYRIVRAKLTYGYLQDDFYYFLDNWLKFTDLSIRKIVDTNIHYTCLHINIFCVMSSILSFKSTFNTIIRAFGHDVTGWTVLLAM